MKYQKLKSLLGNTPNQASKFRTKNWVDINDYSHGTENTNIQFNFKGTLMQIWQSQYMFMFI